MCVFWCVFVDVSELLYGLASGLAEQVRQLCRNYVCMVFDERLGVWLAVENYGECVEECVDRCLEVLSRYRDRFVELVAKSLER